MPHDDAPGRRRRTRPGHRHARAGARVHQHDRRREHLRAPGVHRRRSSVPPRSSPTASAPSSSCSSASALRRRGAGCPPRAGPTHTSSGHSARSWDSSPAPSSGSRAACWPARRCRTRSWERSVAAVPALGQGVPRALVLAALYGGLAALQVRGVRGGVRFVEGVTAAKLVPLLLLLFVGALHVQPANVVWTGSPSLDQIGRSVLLLFFAFQGIENALTSSGEIVQPSRTVPRAILLAIAAITVLYGGIQLVAQGILGPELQAHDTRPAGRRRRRRDRGLGPRAPPRRGRRVDVRVGGRRPPGAAARAVRARPRRTASPRRSHACTRRTARPMSRSWCTRRSDSGLRSPAASARWRWWRAAVP